VIGSAVLVLAIACCSKKNPVGQGGHDTREHEAGPSGAQDAGAIPQSTFFLDDLDLANGALTLTAVFLPDAYVATPSPSAVVYLHGTNVTSIETHLAEPSHALREEMNSLAPAPTDLVLIAPTLGAECNPGDIATKGLDWFLNEVLHRMGTKLCGGACAGFRRVYLAAHSGGGRTARAIAMVATRELRTRHPRTQAYPVSEYWLFDALYAPPGYPPSDKTDETNVKPEGDPDAVEEEWFEVLRTQRVKLLSYYATPEPTRRSENLREFVANPALITDAGAVRLKGTARFVECEDCDHALVAKANWKAALNQRN
jgi:hypothetical protein